MKRFLLAFLLAGLSYAQTNLNTVIAAATVAVQQTSNTPVINPLSGATTIQVYIKPSSTAQIYTITLNNGSTIEVPSGSGFTFKAYGNIASGIQVFQVQTATGAANLQVVAIKEVRQ